MPDEIEEQPSKSVAVKDANDTFDARAHVEQELREAKEALEQSTRELAHSLSLVRATLEATNDGILVTDPQREIVEFNQKFVQMWRLPADLVVRLNKPEIREACSRQFADRDAFIARIEEIYRTSPAESFDILELSDGHIFERASKTQFVDGKDVGRVWTFRDITESRRLEEGRFRLAAIVESSDDAIISKTLDGIITSWNRGAERMFGYTADEIVGKSVTTLIPADRVDEEPGIIKRLKAGERIDHYETVRRRKDGTLFNVSLTVSPIKDDHGKIIGASKIARDITEPVRAAEERTRLLDAECAARTEAERVSLLKDEFFANLSHELRTPLNAILGWAQLLSMGRTDPEELKQGLETIERNARAQTQLIEDLLDMNRIVSGKVRLDVQLLNLGSVVDAAVESARPSAEAKEITLRKIVDPMAGPVSGDPHRLQQVIWNLLSNAVKFTPKGGKVDVVVERVNSHLEITINDTGQGIAPDFLPYVFERFRQADSSTTRKFGGLGLGLSIVKQLVELHGGTIRAESKGEGQGAAFIVSLPLAPIRRQENRVHPTAPKRSTTECDDIHLSGVRILVVDDSPDARELIGRVLSQCKAEVYTAANATEGLRLLKLHKPSVLVSDIGMPEMDGYAFIRTVRALPQSEGGKTPAIALTAFARSEDRTRAMIAGYQVHISKPIEPHELLATVASLAGQMTRRDD